MGTNARWGAYVGTLLAFGACNTFTGADDYVFVDDEDGVNAANGAQVGVGGAGAGVGGAGTGAGINTTDLLPSDAASITAIDINQAVRRPLMANGASVSSSVPLVSGREALMRIHYTTTQPVTVTTVVSIGSNNPIVMTSSLSGTSSVDNLSSTINVTIPAEMMAPGIGYSVELLEAPEFTSGTNGSAVYPGTGQDTMQVSEVGPVRLVLVPVAYGADGSNRVPPTQEGNYRSMFMSLYPVPDVEVVVTGTMQWNSTISPNGSGWGSLLDAIVDLRQSNGAAYNDHYYGIFMPTSSFSSYCSGGCVAGLSMLANSPSDQFARAGIGVGYSGTGTTETAAHEIGHQHGREHAPCQVNDADPGYPHSGGVIGEWGYDLIRGELVPPSTADFMSYCNPTWVSDYTYAALFNRLQAVNGNAAWQFDESQLDRTYERIRIDMDGTSWSEPITLHTPPMGDLTTVTVRDDLGEQEVSGTFYRYSHLPGGVLLFPRGEVVAREASFDISGLRKKVTRPTAIQY